jgi:hypothetical protein
MEKEFHPASFEVVGIQGIIAEFFLAEGELEYHLGLFPWHELTNFSGALSGVGETRDKFFKSHPI